jgi:exonuclease SbcC
MDNISARDYFSKLKIGDLIFNNILNAVKGGNNILENNLFTEKVIADTSWADEVDGLLYSVEAIVKDPKSSIKDEEIIVNIEKAKKITADSIRHLASHTNYITSVDEDGTVNPSKIKTVMLDEELAIYENRFVFTLVQRLNTFVEQKYFYLSDFAQKASTVSLNLKSDFKYLDAAFEFDLRVKAKKAGEEKDAETQALEKIKKIKKRLSILTGTDFFKKMSRTKPLNPPIAKTNIINMNVDYNNCYKLWLLLHSFVNTGYSVSVKDMPLPAEQSYVDDLCYLVAIGVKAMILNNNLNFKGQYEPQAEREFEVKREFNYKPEFKGFESENFETDYLNQYYYQKIKDILSGENKQAGGREDFVFSFGDFYRQLAAVNDNIFEELLSYGIEEYGDGLTVSADKLRYELKRCRELYRRRNMLSRLKKADYELSVKKENFLLAKIKKLEFESQRQLSGDEEAGEVKTSVKAVEKKGKKLKEIVNEIKETDGALAAEIIGEDKE